MYSRVLISTDGSPCSERAVQRGLELAKILSAKVTFLFVLDDPQTSTYAVPDMAVYLPQLYEDLKADAIEVLARAEIAAADLGVPADSRLVEHSSPARAINEAESGFDLVVLGTHGRRGFNRWMFGSVAEGALRRSGVPYLVVRSGPQEGEVEVGGP